MRSLAWGPDTTGLVSLPEQDTERTQPVKERGLRGADTFTLNSQPPQVINTSLACKPSVRGSVSWQPEQTHQRLLFLLILQLEPSHEMHRTS